MKYDPLLELPIPEYNYTPEQIRVFPEGQGILTDKQRRALERREAKFTKTPEELIAEAKADADDREQAKIISDYFDTIDS